MPPEWYPPEVDWATAFSTKYRLTTRFCALGKHTRVETKLGTQQHGKQVAKNRPADSATPTVGFSPAIDLQLGAHSHALAPQIVDPHRP